MMNPYEILGVSADASDGDIKSAFRSMAQKVHPDKVNGDREAFEKLQDAYDFLSDPVARAGYDNTGTTDTRYWQLEAEVSALINNNFTAILIENDYEIIDYVKLMVDHFNGGFERLDLEKQRLIVEIGKMKLLVTKSVCTDNNNLIANSLRQQISAKEKSLSDCEFAIVIANAAVKTLKQYGFEGVNVLESCDPNWVEKSFSRMATK